MKLTGAEKAKRYRQKLVDLLVVNESLIAALNSNNIGRVSNAIDEFESETKTIRQQLEIEKQFEEKQNAQI